MKGNLLPNGRKQIRVFVSIPFACVNRRSLDKLRTLIAPLPTAEPNKPELKINMVEPNISS